MNQPSKICLHVWVFLLVTITTTGLAQEFRDSTKTYRLQEVVVSASRIKEDINKSPVSIERLSLPEIRQSAAPSFFDAIENMKGVQMITPSLGFKVINTRGFTNTTNVRFVQLVDGMDNQAPHLGAPIGNALGPNDLDIESVEIVPGVASALYGMNAINGLANFITKNPFTNQGLSFQQKIGFNRAGSPGGASPFSETSFRWAHVIKPKLAFKLNGSYISGTDWMANDQTDLAPNANITTGLTGADNPAFDPVNGYGNESPNRRTLPLNGKNYVVARTGYYEQEVIDYRIRNFKGDGTLLYNLGPGTSLSYTFRFANLDNVYQRANRFRLEDYQLQQHSLTYQSKSIQVRAYVNLENTGNSYNARSMAENIDKNFKSDDQWFNEYANQYKSAITAGSTVADAHHLARQASDAGRPQPGSEGFQNLVSQLRTINNWDYGAALRVQSRLFHAEGQINLTEKLLRPFFEKTGVELLTGIDHRTYVIVPDGNYFINPMEPGKNLTYSKSGMFLQMARSFISGKIKMGATIRADKNEYFPLKWNPRVTLVYSPAKAHNLRLSYQYGYRFPSVFEAFSNVNSGGVKRVGGLPVMSNGIFENAYLRSSIDAFQTAIIVDVNKNGLTRDQAIVKNQGLLAKNDYTYVQPENISSLEAGYRSLWVNEDLQVDVDFYYNKYTQFIAQVEMNVPKTSNADSIAFYLADKSKQDRYRMYTNSKTIAYNYGSSMGLKYRFYKSFLASGNVTFSKLERKSNNDGFEDGFNTPQWMTHVSLGNDKVFRSLGFMVTYRWQSSYFWQSFLVTGDVPSFQTVDAQISFAIEKVRLKIGGTNILNEYYRSYLGGPSVGGFYYTAISLGL